MTDGQVNGRSNDMNTILTVQLEDLDDNPPEFEFEEKTRDPLSGCAFANELPKIDHVKIQITPCRLISPGTLFRNIPKLRKITEVQ